MSVSCNVFNPTPVVAIPCSYGRGWDRQAWVAVPGLMVRKEMGFWLPSLFSLSCPIGAFVEYLDQFAIAQDLTGDLIVLVQ